MQAGTIDDDRTPAIVRGSLTVRFRRLTGCALFSWLVLVPAGAYGADPAYGAATHCGNPERPSPQAVSADEWRQYRCLSEGDARARWARCLERIAYSDERGSGCPGYERCCPPEPQQAAGAPNQVQPAPSFNRAPSALHGSASIGSFGVPWYVWPLGLLVIAMVVSAALEAAARRCPRCKIAMIETTDEWKAAAQTAAQIADLVLGGLAGAAIGSLGEGIENPKYLQCPACKHRAPIPPPNSIGCSLIALAALWLIVGAFAN